MFSVEVIVVHIILLNFNLFTLATRSEFLRADDLERVYDSYSKANFYFDDFSKYSFEKRLHKRKTTKGTTPTYSEYETAEVINHNEKEKEILRRIKNFTLHILNESDYSSESEFVGGWDEYPLFAKTTQPPDTREKLRLIDKELSKIISNPKRYVSAAHIVYLSVFHYLIEGVLEDLKRWNKNARQLAYDIARGNGPFFMQQRLLDNDTLRSLGWTDHNLREFYSLYEEVKSMFKEMKIEFRNQRYEVHTKEHMTSAEKKIAVIR